MSTAFKKPEDKDAYVALIKEEINTMSAWISETRKGGWSTQLIEHIQKRQAQLLEKLYEIGITL